MNIPPEIEAKIVHAADCKCPTCRARFEPLTVVEEDITAEKEFSAAFIKKARELLWDGYHTYNSRKSAAGFPDWTLWRDRVIFAELKTETGKLSAAQQTVIEGLRRAGAECYVWWPSDWPEIMKTLT